jgi:hypothetical protein
MSQILSIVLWYLLLAVLGWLAFPTAYRFFGALPGRGYAFARPLGLLLWGFLFWVLSSLGLLANEPGGLVTAALLLAAVSAWALRDERSGELSEWLRKNRGHVLGVELVFALAFLFMLWMRLHEPSVFHTEQPMELAFINAILRSPSMPPHDPWLSGFSISYYYFGYLMVAMQAKLLGIAGAVAFNLGFISTFCDGGRRGLRPALQPAGALWRTGAAQPALVGRAGPAIRAAAGQCRGPVRDLARPACLLGRRGWRRAAILGLGLARYQRPGRSAIQ